MPFVLDGRHPLGVRPWGNYLYEHGAADDADDEHENDEMKKSVAATTRVCCRDAGLGSLCVLSDDGVVDVLSHLGAAKWLCMLACCSQSLYVFSYEEELWKTLVLGLHGGQFQFRHNWRTTYRSMTTRDEACSNKPPMQVRGFYSDTLFQSFLCASMHILPEWVRGDSIDRRSGLTVEEFIEQYEKPNRPVILTDVVQHWPAFSKWNKEYLIANSNGALFAAGAANLTMPEYFQYAESTVEERPLYLFDNTFCEKCPQLAQDYTVPPYFSDDLFSVLGTERPDHRWLIVGPTRSGSTFHQDPNATSAFNAVITGRKKWVMLPPSQVPPGVFPSADGGEVATSVSVPEWFMNFLEDARSGSGNGCSSSSSSSSKRPLEGVCNAGEVIFVPRGWWHTVMNIEHSVAITQNFVSFRNLPHVLRFLKNKRDQVSGVCEGEGLYEKFVAALELAHPGAVAKAESEFGGSNNNNKRKASVWTDVQASGGKQQSFKFGFQ